LRKLMFMTNACVLIEMLERAGKAPCIQRVYGECTS
jgi:hypothetical protein